MNNLLLATYLAIGTPHGVALPSEDAPRYAAKALYKELELDRYTKRIEKRILKNELTECFGYGILIGKIVTEKRVSYRWEF